MITPAFVIFSASRSGSTSLYRALNLIPGTWVYYEPKFDTIPLREESVFEQVTKLLSDHSGFKHVFDPTGYPFRDIDWATVDEMERDSPLWDRLNSAILNYPGIRVIFLRRKDGFHRVVSDQIAKITGAGYWEEFRVEEPPSYRQKLSQLSLPPLDENLVKWYVENLPSIHDRLRASIEHNEVLDVSYEELFGPEVAIETRVGRFQALVSFLGIEASPEVFRNPELQRILRPSAKLNDASIFERIPNYRDLRAKLEIGEEVAWHPNGPATDEPSGVWRTSRTTDSPVWSFRSTGDNLAGVVFPADQPDSVRVSISKAATGVSHDIQLNLSTLELLRDRVYRLHFRARAQESRKIAAGVAQAHAPWVGLGWYEEIELSPEWRTFEREFKALDTDSRSRVHFDLGAYAGTVELSQIRLIGVETSK